MNLINNFVQYFLSYLIFLAVYLFIFFHNNSLRLLTICKEDKRWIITKRLSFIISILGCTLIAVEPTKIK